jgi:ADP-ribose pyrophosphatase YjhB (NUDIX family)
VAADAAVLTLYDGALSVLLVADARAPQGVEDWRLPGTFLHPGERLADAVRRALHDKAGVAGIRPRQLKVFDDLDRDDRGWVLSVAHYDAISSDRLTQTERVRMVPIAELPELHYDHAAIVAAAVDELRREYRREPDPMGLLEHPFTLRQLRDLHEAVLGERLLPDTFRRTMLPGLVAVGESFVSGRGRPAELYEKA